LTAETLSDLAVIPVIFAVQTLISYIVSIGVSKAFGLAKRPANFVTAMGVFGNSNSLPISLVISLSQTLTGLHWDRIPGDNDDEVSARGILYLLIFQQLGQLVRWSWGYHVLLAPPEQPEDEEAEAAEEGRYRDDSDSDILLPGLDADDSDNDAFKDHTLRQSHSSTSFDSGGVTPVTNTHYILHDDEYLDDTRKRSKSTSTAPDADSVLHAEQLSNSLTSFPTIRPQPLREEHHIPNGIRGWIVIAELQAKRGVSFASSHISAASNSVFNTLPHPMQRILSKLYRGVARFANGLWSFMNPPLWAMLLAGIVASIPSLQRLFFEEGSFVANSVTRAVSQSGGVAVPLILVVLGANLARNTLPKAALEEDSEENQIGTKLLIASLISRMLLPTLIVAPLLALVAKYVPISIVDDPIFVIVCFLLTGAPSALQLAQICQINGVYEGVMSKILFQSYVIWYVWKLMPVFFV
jgi:auxin efflux carrier family protein